MADVWTGILARVSSPLSSYIQGRFNPMCGLRHWQACVALSSVRYNQGGQANDQSMAKN